MTILRKQKNPTREKAYVTLALTALLCITAFSTANASEDQNQTVNQYYGFPDNAMQYNRTEITPTGQIDQIRENENYVFNYRNLTIAINSTKDCEFKITMDPTLKPKVVSLSIEPTRNMSLTMNMSSTPSEAEMVRNQTLNFYLGLETNANIDLQAQIKLRINQTELSQELNREVNASGLTWQYYYPAEHQWVTVPSWIEQNNYLVCNTTHFSTWTVVEQNTEAGEPSGTGNYPNLPGVPDNAVQHNKTEITPIAEMEQIKAGEPALFQYKNLTMLMNTNQNCSVVFTADPEVKPKIFGLSIVSNQTMTLTMNMHRQPLQGEQTFEHALNFYFGIEPNAEVQLNAQLRFYINQTELNQELNRIVDASKLTWMYWNTTRAQWEPVESFMDQNGYLACNTDHFSTWIVAEVSDQAIPQPEETAAASPTQTPIESDSTSPSPEVSPTQEAPDTTKQNGVPSEYLYLGVAVALAIIMIVGFFALNRRR